MDSQARPPKYLCAYYHTLLNNITYLLSGAHSLRWAAIWKLEPYYYTSAYYATVVSHSTSSIIWLLKYIVEKPLLYDDAYGRITDYGQNLLTCAAFIIILSARASRLKPYLLRASAAD